MREPLFKQLLDASVEELPAPLKYLHDGRSKTLHGQCDVERGGGMLSRLFARMMSLPPAGKNQAIEVIIACNGDGETWIRRFGRRSMQSSLSAQDTLLVELLGPVRFKFKLILDHTGHVNWQLVHVTALGVPLRVNWFDNVKASESADNGNYCFDVTAALPIVGLLVTYKGWLNVA